MCLLFETIACSNGKLQNLEWHNQRLNNSRKKLDLGNDQILLQKINLPEFVSSGKWKCRVTYGKTIEKISFEKYTLKEISSLILIESSIDYSHKFSDRREINRLFANKGQADDIIIIKNGFVTDTSIANILLYDGKQWVTPNTPLLSGTMRSKLIHDGIVEAVSIRKEDLLIYQKLMLVNAMNPFDVERAIILPQAMVSF
jgi:4-amino-4-deoxychorismate lyase